MKYIKVDLTAMPQPLAACVICKATIRVPNRDNFTPYTVLNETTDRYGKTNCRTRLLKNPMDTLRWFQEKHWLSCIRDYKGADDMK